MPHFSFNINNKLFKRCLFSISMSNLPLSRSRFGLSLTFYSLLGPIGYTRADFLDIHLSLDASKSILLFCHEYFGLSLEFSSFQGPIHHFLATVLDLQQPFICSKVQSATFSQSIWTFSNLFSASASNPQNPRTSLLTQQASFTLAPVSGMPS